MSSSPVLGRNDIIANSEWMLTMCLKLSDFNSFLPESLCDHALKGAKQEGRPTHEIAVVIWEMMVLCGKA